MKAAWNSGFGEVYPAEHFNLKVTRALKCISKCRYVHRTAVREADILKNLRHPAIPIIFLVGYLKQKFAETIEKMFQIIYNVRVEMNKHIVLKVCFDFQLEKYEQRIVTEPLFLTHVRSCPVFFKHV